MKAAREARIKAAGIIPVVKPQEPAPNLFPDMLWVWSTFCFLSERRGVSANGPVPITMEAMHAFSQMTNRHRHPYIEQLLRFIPELDREYLRDFYDKQKKDMEKQRKKAESGGKSPRGGVGRR